jgi:hypothetical protein
MNNKRIKDTNDQRHLAALVYDIGLRKQVEELVKSKYLKRIDYLVEANNELMNELEMCESEIINVEKNYDKEREGNVSIPNSIADGLLLNEKNNEN